MGTRALYTFIEKGSTWNVYKHWDGYPTGAAEFLEKAKKLAWELPRYEADEFATAFIAANKNQAGNIRMMPQGKPDKVATKNCSDIEYRYEVYLHKKHQKLYVNAYEMDHSVPGDWHSPLTSKRINPENQTIGEFGVWARDREAN
jgi:hypothetical protein